MNEAEKRSVATDALETLGKHNIPDNSGRDAIHLAVEPVVAGMMLYPGQQVGIANSKATTTAKPLGIVDPFLPGPVDEGGRFWLVVFPRQITSLRHVWEHPDFPSDSGNPSKADAEAWLRNYASEIDEGFNTLMEAADAFLDSGEYFYGARTGDYHGKFEGESTHPDFWKHYQIYRGRTVPEDEQESFFTCSC